MYLIFCKSVSFDGIDTCLFIVFKCKFYRVFFSSDLVAIYYIMMGLVKLMQVNVEDMQDFRYK